MLKWISQVVALTAFNLRTIPQRKGSSLSFMVGIAGVVAVFVGVLSIGQGISRTMKQTGAADIALVLRSGADSEMTSLLLREETNLIGDAPGVARADGVALVSPELFVIINLPKRSTGTDVNIPFRGVERPVLGVRTNVKIVDGRMFEWGRNEVIVGRGALIEFAGLERGKTIRIGQNDWSIVGIFESKGGIEESEIWTDAAVLQPAYHRGSSYQAALVRLASAGSFDKFKDALTTDPRLNVKVLRMTDYYAEQSRTLNLLITGLGSLVAGLMGIGALFGALNTMYTAVASRGREIATLKALGFGSSPVVISIITESLLLATVGGTAGALLAWVAFDGYRAATLNWQSFSQVTFAFDVNGPLLVEGIVCALVIGLVGGLFPAIRAARLPVSVALRES
ncbi:MAG: ABC transporter permease [Thermoanaerobaculia bacterium]|jgi:putative ABC transport system permease protein